MYRLSAKGEVEDFRKMSKDESLGYMQKLINHSLLMQEAKASGYTIDKKKLENQVKQFIKKFGSKEKFEQFLKKRLLTMDTIKNEAVRNLVISDMLKTMHSDLAQRIDVSQEEIKEYHKSHVERFPGEVDKHMEKIKAHLKNDKKKELLAGLYEKLKSKSKIEIFKDKL